MIITLTPLKFLFGNPPSLSPSLDKGGFASLQLSLSPEILREFRGAQPPDGREGGQEKLLFKFPSN